MPMPIKKETLAQVFSCEFCEISQNTFFTEHLWTTASISSNPHHASILTWNVSIVKYSNLCILIAE